MFPSARLTMEDVISSWAGLRPLIHEDGKSPSELSRKDEMFYSRSGLISIAGGKLTGYRKMAERVVDQVADKLDVKTKKCSTQNTPLDGNNFSGYRAVDNYVKEILRKYPGIISGLSQAKYLVYNYGINSEIILKMRDNNPDLSLIESELLYTIEHEMVQTALDFFERRTGRMNFNLQSVKENADNIINLLAEKLDWTASRIKSERQKLRRAVNAKTTFE